MLSRRRWSAFATALALAATVMAGAAPVEALGNLVVQGYVNGHPQSPKHELHGDWMVGESVTTTIYDTAAKGSVLFTETFDYAGAGPRPAVGPRAPETTSWSPRVPTRWSSPFWMST